LSCARWIDRTARRLTRTLVGPGLPVWSVAFLPDSRTLLTGGADNIIRRWNAATGEPVDPILLETAGDPLAAFSGDPTSVRRHTDLVGARITIIAYHRPHRVCPMVIVVAGNQRRVAATVRGFERIVVVVKVAAAQITAILAHQSGMDIIDAGIDVSNDNTIAAHAKRGPDLGRVDAVDVPLDNIDCGLGLPRERIRERIHPGWEDLLHLRELGNLFQQGLVASHPDGIDNPKGPVRRVVLRQQRAQT